MTTCTRYSSIYENAIFEINNLDSPIKQLTIAIVKKENSALISISNTGNRIAPQKLNEVFDPFYTMKDPGEGTGLGLSICYSLIKEHCGEIRAENHDIGVTISFKLPLSN